MSNLVTFEQAKKLDALVFWEWTFRLYDKDNKLSHHAFEKIIELNNASDYYKAPTVSEALQWIRETKELYFHVCCFHCFLTKDVRYKGEILSNSATMITTVTGFCKHYPKAESALFDAVLTYLEKKI